MTAQTSKTEHGPRGYGPTVMAYHTYRTSHTLLFNVFMRLTVAVAATSLSACMKWEYGNEEEDFTSAVDGLFVLCEGNFQYSNATMSFYDPASGQVENEVFFRANGYKLGDVAQSMTMHDGTGWVVVNNSHVLFAIDAMTFRERGRVENLPSPRYIHFVNDRKAYVTQLWDNRIFIIDPKRYEITGHITVPDMDRQSGSTEQMVQSGQYVYCTCWSYQNRVIKIDTSTDRVVAQAEVGRQPMDIALDSSNKLWVITDGGYQQSPTGYEAPTLCRLNASTMNIERQLQFKLGETPTGLQLNASADTLYWINGGVWRMPTDDTVLPAKPFIEAAGTRFYQLSISPYDGDVYVADAIDYQQPGMVYRYSSNGTLKERFNVGITPSSFCWK